MHSRLNKSSVKNQVKELMLTMTLAQKIGQVIQAERLNCMPSEAKSFQLGSVMCGAGSPPDNYKLEDWLKMADHYWKASSKNDENHHGIPVLFGVDAIHGHNNLNGATIFPHNIGLGAANDAKLIKEMPCPPIFNYRSIEEST